MFPDSATDPETCSSSPLSPGGAGIEGSRVSRLHPGEKLPTAGQKSPPEGRSGGEGQRGAVYVGVMG